jgi:hypothetical protein
MKLQMRSKDRTASLQLRPGSFKGSPATDPLAFPLVKPRHGEWADATGGISETLVARRGKSQILPVSQGGTARLIPKFL